MTQSRTYTYFYEILFISHTHTHIYENIHTHTHSHAHVHHSRLRADQIKSLFLYLHNYRVILNQHSNGNYKIIFATPRHLMRASQSKWDDARHVCVCECVRACVRVSTICSCYPWVNSNNKIVKYRINTLCWIYAHIYIHSYIRACV